MKNLLWLALLTPFVASANPYTIEHCLDKHDDDICIGLNLDRDRLDALEAGGSGPTPLRFVLRDAASTIVGDAIDSASYQPTFSGFFKSTIRAYFFVGGIAYVFAVNSVEGGAVLFSVG